VPPRKKNKRHAAAGALSACLLNHVALDTRQDGEIAASFDGLSINLGKFSIETGKCAQALRVGIPLRSFASPGRDLEKEIHCLVRRLAERGLIEYRLGRWQNGDAQVVIEPQRPDYWPQAAQLRGTDVLVLSRFAYMRRRASDLVLESPTASAVFKIRDPEIAGALTILFSPQTINRLRRERGFPGNALIALLLDCELLIKIDAAKGTDLRFAEGDTDLVLWDFHDLLFHARSSEGRHANPVGGFYAHVGALPPLPAMRAQWPGNKIDLCAVSSPNTKTISAAAELFCERHSTREFDDQKPITLAELSKFLDGTAHVKSQWSSPIDFGDRIGTGPLIGYTVRPYPSGGSNYGLELYLAVNKCEGVQQGFYHYDAGEHALVSIDVRKPEFETLLNAAAFAMGASSIPQVLIIITARFGRSSWKYSSIAYALILKDVGVLTQTLYLMATAMELGGCAIGTANIDLFAKLTGIDFHIEGPVGQFAVGRAATSADFADNQSPD
jgi:SagB-type dehydrogenase family enzyme